MVALAHQIVATASGPAAEAAALARWFDSGRYRYTLTPPAASGPDALESFLFTTRAGFCQQFAAAYGVLARIDGLPTRVAVGFTTGDSVGRQRYQITGADAHVWPEVYLGPATGWTSYEPTPASSGESTGVGVNSGLKSEPQNRAAKSTATTQSTVATIRHPSSTANVTVPTTTPLTGRARAKGAVASSGSSRNTLAVVAVVAAVLALVVGVGLWVRRLLRRGWDPVTRGAIDAVGAGGAPPPTPPPRSWPSGSEAATVLERARLGRRPAETLQEHARRLRSLVGAKWLMPYRPVTDRRERPDPARGGHRGHHRRLHRGLCRAGRPGGAGQLRVRPLYPRAGPRRRAPGRPGPFGPGPLGTSTRRARLM